MLSEDGGGRHQNLPQMRLHPARWVRSDAAGGRVLLFPRRLLLPLPHRPLSTPPVYQPVAERLVFLRDLGLRQRASVQPDWPRASRPHIAPAHSDWAAPVVSAFLVSPATERPHLFVSCRFQTSICFRFVPSTTSTTGLPKGSYMAALAAGFAAVLLLWLLFAVQERAQYAAFVGGPRSKLKLVFLATTVFFQLVCGPFSLARALYNPVVCLCLVHVCARCGVLARHSRSP